jgi:hypothetical protein
MAIKGLLIRPEFRKANQTRIEWIQGDIVGNAAIRPVSRFDQTPEMGQHLAHPVRRKPKSAEYRNSGIHIFSQCQLTMAPVTSVSVLEVQPFGRTTLSVEAGWSINFADGRRGRATSSPPQLGHDPRNGPSAQGAQNVHSNEQIRASTEPGGRLQPQHSQLGLS